MKKLTVLQDTILTRFPIHFHRLQPHQFKTIAKGEKLIITSPFRNGDYISFETCDRGYEGKWYIPSMDIEIEAK